MNLYLIQKVQEEVGRETNKFAYKPNYLSNIHVNSKVEYDIAK
jgi:hypothetical protein